MSSLARFVDSSRTSREVREVPISDITPSPEQVRPAKNRDRNVIDGALLCVMRHVDGVSTSCCHRPTNPARAAPRHGASQKSQSWPIYAPPANSAGPVLRAGLTDAFVTGIRNRWIRVRHSPIGMPANPTAAPFEVVPMITYRKKKVAMTSLKRDDTSPYLPGLRSPKPLEANPPATQ
jgi:hypothetical protein